MPIEYNREKPTANSGPKADEEKYAFNPDTDFSTLTC